MSSTRFQHRLKEARESAGFRSQQALASAFGVAQSTVGGWEAGKREPDLETLKRLAVFLNVSLDWITGLADENKKPAGPVKLSLDAIAVAQAYDAADDEQRAVVRFALRDLLSLPIADAEAI